MFWCKHVPNLQAPFFKYSYVKDYMVSRGAPEHKINYGITSWNQPNIDATQGNWRGKSLLDHLNHIKEIAPQAGIAIWDLQFLGIYGTKVLLGKN